MYPGQFILPREFYFNLLNWYFQESKPGQTWNSTRCAQTSSAVAYKGRYLSCLVQKTQVKKCISLCFSEAGFTCHTIYVLYSKGKIPSTSWWRVSTPMKKRMVSHRPGQWRKPRHWLRVCVYLGHLLWNRQCLILCKLMIVMYCVVLMSGPIDGWEILGSKPT